MRTFPPTPTPSSHYITAQRPEICSPLQTAATDLLLHIIRCGEYFCPHYDITTYSKGQSASTLTSLALNQVACVPESRSFR